MTRPDRYFDTTGRHPYERTEQEVRERCEASIDAVWGFTNEQLAEALSQNDVDGIARREAARRLRATPTEPQCSICRRRHGKEIIHHSE